MIALTPTQIAALIGLYGLKQRQLLTAKLTHQAAPYGQPTKETVSEPSLRDQAAWIEADLQTTLERHILRDGPRLLTVLAPYCMPGDDPVEVLKEAIRQAGWDQCEEEAP